MLNTTGQGPAGRNDMSDAAFPTAMYPAYTTNELRDRVADPELGAITRDLMEREIARRELVAAGDVSVMTPGERLNFLQDGRRTSGA